MSFERVMVYPFDSHFSPVLRHKELIKSFKIAAVVSPPGWGLAGKDASFVDGGGFIDIAVKSNFDEALDICDAVFFTQSEYSNDVTAVHDKFHRAIEKGRDIICTIPLEKGEYEVISELCELKNLTFRYFGPSCHANVSTFSKAGMKAMMRINTPVIFVLGLGERTNKFEIQLMLREKLLNDGYRLCQVGSRNYCELFGFHSFPIFMFDNSILEGEKVILFNHFIKELELIEKPDLIVVGIPGGIMAINGEFTNGFGVSAYEISQAVRPDGAILSSFYEDCPSEFFSDISAAVMHRFGFKIDCHNMANIKLDLNDSYQQMQLSYIRLASSFVDGKIKRYKNAGVPIYNALNPMDTEKMYTELVNMFSADEAVEIL